MNRRGDSKHPPARPSTRRQKAAAPVPAEPLRGENDSTDPRARAPLPITTRLGIDERFTGRGVVAAFLDAGFYAHPDLTTPHSRIHAYHDLTGGPSGLEVLNEPGPSSWHGMMSTVVAAGNGALSSGRFRGAAPDLGLVLVKVGHMSRVLHDDLARGIEWVLLNRGRYDIRVLNISAGGDYEASYLDDVMSRFAEAAIRAGIVVVAAVGNQGAERPGYVVPPASVPAVISVGGVNDHGNPMLGRATAYRSSFGPTIDGLQKPEICTIAEWVPAPILPLTPTAQQIELLTRLHHARDEELDEILRDNRGVLSSLDQVRGQPSYLIRQCVDTGLKNELVINRHYKMVDGTSFAAPIVTSVVAQMLEANPALKPHEIKRILMQTARRIDGVDPVVQGWGAIQPKAAIDRALAQRKL